MYTFAFMTIHQRVEYSTSILLSAACEESKFINLFQIYRDEYDTTITVRMRYSSWHISLPSSAKQQREMTKFCAL